MLFDNKILYVWKISVRHIPHTVHRNKQIVNKQRKQIIESYIKEL